jgi:hypothetical protein
MRQIINVVFLATMAFSVSMSAANPTVDLTKKEVKVLIVTAKTPNDHLKLAHYYQQRADVLVAKASEHEKMAEATRENRMAGSKFFPMTAGHCQSSAKSYRKEADKMKAMAAEHRAMAEKAGM